MTNEFDKAVEEAMAAEEAKTDTSTFKYHSQVMNECLEKFYGSMAEASADEIIYRSERLSQLDIGFVFALQRRIITRLMDRVACVAISM